MSFIDFSSMSPFLEACMENHVDVASSTDSMPSQTDSDHSSTSNATQVISDEEHPKFEFLKNPENTILDLLNNIPIEGRIEDDFDAPFSSIEILIDEESLALFSMDLPEKAQERCNNILKALFRERSETLKDISSNRVNFRKFYKDYMSIKDQVECYTKKLNQLCKAKEKVQSEIANYEEALKRAKSDLSNAFVTMNIYSDEKNILSNYRNNIEMNISTILLFINKFPNRISSLRKAYLVVMTFPKAELEVLLKILKAYPELQLDTTDETPIEPFKISLEETQKLLDIDTDTSFKQAAKKLNTASEQLERIYRKNPEFFFSESFHNILNQYIGLLNNPLLPNDPLKTIYSKLYYSILSEL